MNGMNKKLAFKTKASPINHSNCPHLFYISPFHTAIMLHSVYFESIISTNFMNNLNNLTTLIHCNSKQESLVSHRLKQPDQPPIVYSAHMG